MQIHDLTGLFRGITPNPQEMETQLTDLVNKVKAPETETAQNLSSHNRKTNKIKKN